MKDIHGTVSDPADETVSSTKPPELVSRPRLVERLHAALPTRDAFARARDAFPRTRDAFARALTLVSAPAGFGKTTLVSEWAHKVEEPVRPLARLRARGQLTELRASDLRLPASEAAEFLNRMMGLDLSAEDIAALEARTEGWIASLQLAAISIQGRKDTSTLIESFTGSHRYVLDYLVVEVLEQRPVSCYPLAHPPDAPNPGLTPRIALSGDDTNTTYRVFLLCKGQHTGGCRRRDE